MARFHKMHGLGNDFVVFDAREVPVRMTDNLAKALSDRRTGIGCDQLIVVGPSDVNDVEMLIWNADGGEVEACGNASRCVAKLIGGDLVIDTRGGTIFASSEGAMVTVDLRQLGLDWRAIPLAYEMPTYDMPLGWGELERPSAVNVGNPHLIFFVSDPDQVDLGAVGPVIEGDPLFPERINVNIASVTGPQSLKLRTWERGAGLTRACGTGACATAVEGIRSGRVLGPVTVSMPGGELTVDWRAGERIRMTGPATHVFTGEIDLGAFGG